MVQMSFKDISYLELCQPFCPAKRNHLFNFRRGYYEEQFCEVILNFDKWFRWRCLLNSPYLEPWRSFRSEEWNYLCNVGRSQNEEQFCEFISTLGQWFRRCRFKRFLIWSSGGPPVQWSGTIYAISKEDFMGNIHVKLYERISGSG